MTANSPQIAGKESAIMKSRKSIESKREKNTGSTKGQRRKKYGMKVAVISNPLTKK